LSGSEDPEVVAAAARRELGLRNRKSTAGRSTRSRASRREANIGGQEESDEEDSGSEEETDEGRREKEKRRREEKEKERRRSKSKGSKKRRSKIRSEKSEEDSEPEVVREKKKKKGEDSEDREEDGKRKKKSKKRKERSDSEDGAKKKSKRKNRYSDSESEDEYDNFEKLAPLWRLEARPDWLQCRKTVNKTKWSTLMEYRREYRAEAKEIGLADSMFAADAQIKEKVFGKAADNRADKLHQAASMLRLPVIDPEDYWARVPLKRDQIFRNVPLTHCNGSTVINELALVRLHDRTTPVTLKLFVDSNFAKRPAKEAAIDSDWDAPVKLKMAQSAFFSYTAALRAIWPMDYTPEALGQLFVKMEWGGTGRSDAGRAGLIQTVFDRVMIENAQRAVKKKAPAEYRRIKEIWEEIVDKLPGGTSASEGNNLGHQHSDGTRHGGRGGVRGGFKGISTLSAAAGELLN